MMHHMVPVPNGHACEFESWVTLSVVCDLMAFMFVQVLDDIFEVQASIDCSRVIDPID